MNYEKKDSSFESIKLINIPLKQLLKNNNFELAL